MTISIIPVPKPRMTQSDRWRKRPAVLRYFAYCDALREALPDHNVPEELKLEFGLPMPKSWSDKKKLLMAGQPHKQRPDVDNLSKAYMDALCKEDSYVWHLDARKYWSTEGYIKLLA